MPDRFEILKAMTPEKVATEITTPEMLIGWMEVRLQKAGPVAQGGAGRDGEDVDPVEDRHPRGGPRVAAAARRSKIAEPFACWRNEETESFDTASCWDGWRRTSSRAGPSPERT